MRSHCVTVRQKECWPALAMRKYAIHQSWREHQMVVCGVVTLVTLLPIYSVRARVTVITIQSVTFVTRPFLTWLRCRKIRAPDWCVHACSRGPLAFGPDPSEIAHTVRPQPHTIADNRHAELLVRRIPHRSCCRQSIGPRCPQPTYSL